MIRLVLLALVIFTAAAGASEASRLQHNQIRRQVLTIPFGCSSQNFMARDSSIMIVMTCPVFMQFIWLNGLLLQVGLIEKWLGHYAKGTSSSNMWSPAPPGGAAFLYVSFPFNSGHFVNCNMNVALVHMMLQLILYMLQVYIVLHNKVQYDKGEGLQLWSCELWYILYIVVHGAKHCQVKWF